MQNWREKGQFDSWDYEALCKWMDLGLKGEDISIHRVLDEMQKMSRQDIRDIAIGVKSPPEVKGYGLSR